MSSPLRRLFLATSNTSKIEEMEDEFRGLGIEVTSPDREGIHLERPEVGENYCENAQIKAREGIEKSGLPSLADDSGLEVEALGGNPGIHSARWGGENASDRKKNQLLLEELSGTSPINRTARFVCSMVLFYGNGKQIVTRGVCRGRVAKEPKGDEGFGYDPIFEVKEAGWATFAELDSSAKKRISHRARALDEMFGRLEDRGLVSVTDPID